MPYSATQIRQIVDEMIESGLERKGFEPTLPNKMAVLNDIMYEISIDGLWTNDRIVFYEFCKIRMKELINEQE